MQTAEPDFTREATGRMVKTPDINYTKEDLSKVVDNTIHIGAE